MSIKYIPMTNENILKLIKCEKLPNNVSKIDFKSDANHKRADFKLTSIDGKHKFSVFMRINKDFQENFSIGLIYHPKEDRSVLLFRCNGKHNNIPRLGSEHHNSFHYHYEVAENICDGLNPMNNSKLTNEYSTFDQAKLFFIKYCSIINPEKIFPDIMQMKLEFDME